VRRVLPPLGVAAFAAVIACAWLLGDGSDATYRGGLAAVSVATAVLIWAAVTPGSRLGRTLEARPVRAIGKRSYGLYLWHWPVLVLVQAIWPTSGDVALRTLGIGLVALAITVLAAMASYRFIEQPVRRLGFRRLTRAIVARTRGHRGDRRLAYGALALVALGVAGTVAAIATAPTQTVAQRNIEAGARALKTPPPTAAPAPAPTDAAMPTGSDITAIGDSVMLASAPELQRAFPGIAIDAVVSRQMHAAPGLLQSMADAGTLRRVVVIGLGTNGSISDDTLRRIRGILGSERELVLVTVQAPRPWTDGVNQELRSFAAGNRHTVALADWQSRIAPRLDLLAGDQIHPGSQGGALYASTVQAALEHLVKASWHGWLPRSGGAPVWR
jgi:lysophospholipase L1-like esterase